MQILLVDDERYAIEYLFNEVKSVFPDALIDMFNDGIPAFEAVKQKKYDLAITDITMQRMNGDELAVKIHEYDPDVQILFETGDSESGLKKRGIQIERCLIKPVSNRDIREKICNLHKLPPFIIAVPQIETEVKMEQKGFLHFLKTKMKG